MITNLEQAIREYLPNVIHMSLATARDNKPWVCEVHYAYDTELNLYFRSKVNTRHSSDVRDNPHVSGNIVEQHQQGDKPRGIYFEGMCTELNEVNETSPAFASYAERFDFDKSDLEDQTAPDGHRFYKITVSKFYIFDARESQPSSKYELTWPQ